MNPFEESRIHESFPALSGLCYLNAAGEGALPRAAAEAMAVALAQKERPAAIGREHYGALPAAVRESLARLVGAEPDEIALTGSTSAGLGLVAREFPFPPGGEVLLPEGQFPSNVLPWKAAERRGAVLRRVPLRRGESVIEALRAAAGPRTVLISADWMNFATGVVAEIEEIGALCRRLGSVFVLDAAQGLGAVRLDARRCGAHVVAAPGHKWLLGPPGTGFLYVSKELRGFHPWNAGWMHVALKKGFARLADFDPDEVPPEADRMENGTPSWITLAGWKASLDLLEGIGPERVERRVGELADAAREAVRHAGLELVSPEAPPLAGPIVVAGAGDHTRVVHHALAESGVVTALRGGIRLSPHVYNTESDMVRFETAARLALSEATGRRRQKKTDGSQVHP